MDLKQLQYFVQATEDNSFSCAAKNLFLTQQALSKAIKNLEEELDVPLLIRNQSGLKLTEYGKLVYSKAKQILHEVHELEEEILQLKKKLNKRVTIAVSYGVLNTVSPNILTQIQLSHPYIELIIRDYPDQVCEDMVLDEQADMACVVGPIREHLFKNKLLFSEVLYLLMNKENELSEVESITTKDLRYQEYLLGTDDFNISKAFKSYCKKQGFRPKVNFVSNESALLMSLVSFNKGVTLVPSHDTPQVANSNLCSKKLPNDILNWKVFLIRKEDKEYPQCVNTLWDFLLGNFNRYIV